MFLDFIAQNLYKGKQSSYKRPKRPEIETILALFGAVLF